MLVEIFEIVDKLLDIVPKNQRDVIKVFKKSLIENELNTARIISDELVDFLRETNSNKNALEMSEDLYDLTMEYYEKNYND